MDRRELLKMVAAATGGVVIGGEFFLAGCKNPEAGVGVSNTFTESDIAFLDEVAETIFPKTNTPGAKDAKVGQFMTVMVNDCYEQKDKHPAHPVMPMSLHEQKLWIRHLSVHLRRIRFHMPAAILSPPGHPVGNG